MIEAQISRKDSEITLTVRIPAAQVAEAFARVKQSALKEVKVSGFRPGKAPSKLAESQLNEDALAQNLFQELIPLSYAQAVSQHKLRPIVPPQVTVKSFKKNEDLVFEARTAEAPAVSLGDYQKALRSLKGKVIFGPDGKPLGEGEKITASQVLEKLRETAKIDIPHLLIDYEVQRMLSSLLDQVNSLGLTVEQYLSSQGKRAEDLQKEYHEIAERNLKDEFVLVQLAKESGIKVSEKEIEEAIEAAPDEKTRAGLQEQRGRAYLEDILCKRKTIEHLIKIAEG
ncbi:MAG: trigger factor [candidate division WWE3 bacterium]|nr:trigger factor [candidate division WWE3 bacterium]